jgi:thiol-disulfide isomerase/thioredoxin
MLRRLLLAALFVSAAGLAVAQDAKKDDKASLADKLKDLRAEMQKVTSEAVKGINAEKDPAARSKLIGEYQKIPATFAPKFLELAKSDPKDAAALDAAIAAVSPGKTGDEALEFFVANFDDDDKLATAIPLLARSDAGQKALETLGDKSKSKAVRGNAKFALVQQLVENTDYPRTGKQLPADEAAKNYAAAESKLKAIAAEFGDETIPSPRGAAVKIADAAKKLDFFINNLTVGKKAPLVECATLDADGTKAKLSDYKGKVVVLDIWATWCGPCIAMIPHETEMVKKLKDKPFMLVSVSADEKKETLTTFLEKKPMPWTHWWNGKSGNVLETYQVRFFPTVYVLDAKGVIRHKHLRGDDLEHAVEKLIAEMEKSESK